MPLPEYDPVRFAKPPLRLVVCQVRFPSLLRIADPTFVANFQEAIGGDYPDLQREEQVAFQVSTKGMAENSHVMLYRFSDTAGAWSVLLGENSLTLETRVYSSVDDLLGRFERVTNAAQETLGIEVRQRLGLRYVNEFRRSGAGVLSSWRESFRPEFLGFAASLFDEHVPYMLQQVQVERPDGVFVVRHGLLQGSVIPAQPPMTVARGSGPQDPFYLLDLDYSDTRAVALDVAQSRTQLRAYNTFLFRFFRWTLSEVHYATLEPQ